MKATERDLQFTVMNDVNRLVSEDMLTRKQAIGGLLAIARKHHVRLETGCRGLCRPHKHKCSGRASCESRSSEKKEKKKIKIF